MYKKLFPMIAGLSASLAIAILAYLDQYIEGSIWLMAPFGATTVLVFALPDSPLAQPRNVIFGHLLAATVGLIFVKFVGVYPWSLGLATGVAISLMLITKTTHPPAGANPILVMLLNPGWGFLLTPVLVGAVIIAVLGYLLNRAVKANS
ncbi:MAG: HPP family protein [Pseudomonadales bacterium]|nr:HPP family protein [Pseudomonadales bacterium]NRA14283.1 HPP family protein [Oceanospirillaceae bacterium]